MKKSNVVDFDKYKNQCVSKGFVIANEAEEF
jgi:hypothetical protein